jgi:hypothetical protein
VTKTIKKLIPMNRKQLITLVAAFLAAMTFGFLGEIEGGSKTRNLTREDVGKEISRVIETLKPVLKQDTHRKIAANFIGKAPEKILVAAQAGIVRKFPDAAWKLDIQVNRGEAIHYLAETVRFIRKKLKHKQSKIHLELKLLEEKSRWIASDLKILSEIGVLNSFADINKNPESQIDISEFREITSSIISYYSSKFFIIQKQGNKLKVTCKGVLKPLYLEGWQLSFDNKTWYKVPQDGYLPILKDKRIMSLYFRHKDFLNAGPVEIPTFRPVTAFVKLRTNYRKFVRNRLETINKRDSSNEKIDIKRIKRRLQELKAQRGLAQPENAVKIDLEPVAENQKKVVNKKENSLPEKKSSDSFSKLKNLKADYRIKTEDNKKQNQITIKGRVFDGLNNTPLNSAMVLADKKTISINEEGLFTLKALKDSIIKFTAYCEGYKVLEMKHRITGKNKILNLPLKPELTMFSGRVTDLHTQKPVIGAIVKIKDKTAKSNAHGIFTVRGIKPGYHQISCSADNFLEAHEIVFVRKNQKNLYHLKVRQAFSQSLEY